MTLPNPNKISQNKTLVKKSTYEKLYDSTKAWNEFLKVFLIVLLD